MTNASPDARPMKSLHNCCPTAQAFISDEAYGRDSTRQEEKREERRGRRKHTEREGERKEGVYETRGRMRKIK
jgi:hypothetical protein